MQGCVICSDAPALCNTGATARHMRIYSRQDAELHPKSNYFAKEGVKKTQLACRYLAAKAELAGIESQVLAMAQEQDTVSMSGVGVPAHTILHCDSSDSS